MTDPYNTAKVPVIDEDALEWREPSLFDTQRIREALDRNRKGDEDNED